MKSSLKFFLKALILAIIALSVIWFINDFVQGLPGHFDKNSAIQGKGDLFEGGDYRCYANSTGELMNPDYYYQLCPFGSYMEQEQDRFGFGFILIGVPALLLWSLTMRKENDPSLHQNQKP